MTWIWLEFLGAQGFWGAQVRTALLAVFATIMADQARPITTQISLLKQG